MRSGAAAGTAVWSRLCRMVPRSSVCYRAPRPPAPSHSAQTAQSVACQGWREREGEGRAREVKGWKKRKRENRNAKERKEAITTLVGQRLRFCEGDDPWYSSR